MTPTVFLLAFVVVVVACAVQGAVGFGANLLAMPIIVQLDPSLVPGPVLLATCLLNLFVVWTERASVEVGTISAALVGRVVGTIGAVIALGYLSTSGISLVVGLVVLAAVAIAASGVTAERTTPNMVTAGTISGFTATTAGIGGPPVALLFADASGPKIRGSLALYFTVGLGMTLTGLARADRFGLEHIQSAVALAPASVIGFALSRPLSRVVDRGYARPAILTLCTLAAVILLVRLGLASLDQP